MATLTEVLTHLEETGQHDAINFDNVRRVLLRDSQWHAVYKATEADREELTKTLEYIRRRCSQLCRNKTDNEIQAEPSLRELIPLRQRAERLAAKPFRTIVIQGERWAMWPEGQDPIPSLMQVVAPWREVMALEIA